MTIPSQHCASHFTVISQIHYESLTGTMALISPAIHSITLRLSFICLLL